LVIDSDEWLHRSDCAAESGAVVRRGMLRMLQRGHRKACFEPDPDKAPLESLCLECRDVLRQFARVLESKAKIERAARRET